VGGGHAGLGPAVRGKECLIDEHLDQAPAVKRKACLSTAVRAKKYWTKALL
jgi:hypothetical protein